MADNGTRAGITELLVGVPFPALAFEIMRYVTAPTFFPKIMFSGATFAPADALVRGLIDETVPADTLMDRAIAAADTLAALSPPAFSLTKQQMRQPVAERTAANEAAYGKAVTDAWAAQGGHGCMGRASDPRLHPRLRGTDVEESLIRPSLESLLSLPQCGFPRCDRAC
jgi:enoyl-CoA hydratase